MLGCRLCSLHTSATGLCSACCRICSLNSLSNLLFVVMVLPPSNTRLQKLISLRTNRGAVQMQVMLPAHLSHRLMFSLLQNLQLKLPIKSSFCGHGASSFKYQTSKTYLTEN